MGDLNKVKEMIETDEKVVKTKITFLQDGKQKYRYLLEKWWEENTDNFATIIMLNPSKADSIKMDLTIMNVMNYFVDNGLGGMKVLNLFSFMSTNPDNLKDRNEDYEALNLEYIKDVFKDSEIIIIAWTRGEKITEKRKLKETLSLYSDKLKCFKDNKGKIMRHPSRGFNNKWTLVDYGFEIEGL
ncbi:DUF1643 domain-containing protein [Cytobacillus sp. Hz8]|uniref:DUF1643 domain-containing protein n=1 Tax=Cytobacillus sp. Hz8 TaxID=3347168 RepID=UPI0035E39545